MTVLLSLGPDATLLTVLDTAAPLGIDDGARLAARALQKGSVRVQDRAPPAARAMIVEVGGGAYAAAGRVVLRTHRYELRATPDVFPPGSGRRRGRDREPDLPV